MGTFLMDLRQRAGDKRQRLEQTASTSRRELAQMQAVEAYLARDDAFDGSDIQRESAILRFLGYSESDIQLLAESVNIKPEPAAQVRRGQFRYWENGQWYTTQVVDLDPEHEEYYQFDLYGIFKIVKGSGFYSLTENGWERDGEAMRRYYDVQYDYWKISYNLVEETPAPEKRCPKCHSTVDPAYSFCIRCGADLRTPRCTDCGEELPEDAAFCPYCGKKQ